MWAGSNAALIPLFTCLDSNRQATLDLHPRTSTPASAELGSQSRNSLANALRKENRDLLESAMTLLAYYDNPQASPVGHLLRADKRAALAEEVSRAVLEHGGHAPRPAIEVAARQAVLCVEEGRRLKMAKMGLVSGWEWTAAHATQSACGSRMVLEVSV